MTILDRVTSHPKTKSLGGEGDIGHWRSRKAWQIAIDISLGLASEKGAEEAPRPRADCWRQRSGSMDQVLGGDNCARASADNTQYAVRSSGLS